MVKREPTSINVNPELWKEAKIQAIRKGITVTDLVEDAIEKWIEEEAQTIAKASKK